LITTKIHYLLRDPFDLQLQIRNLRNEVRNEKTHHFFATVTDKIHFRMERDKMHYFVILRNKHRCNSAFSLFLWKIIDT